MGDGYIWIWKVIIIQSKSRVERVSLRTSGNSTEVGSDEQVLQMLGGNFTLRLYKSIGTRSDEAVRTQSRSVPVYFANVISQCFTLVVPEHLVPAVGMFSLQKASLEIL
jgi:hypothetical protein